MLPDNPVLTPNETVYERSILLDHMMTRGEKISGSPEDTDCTCGCGGSDRKAEGCICTVRECLRCAVWVCFDPALPEFPPFRSSDLRPAHDVKSRVIALKQSRDLLADQAIVGAATNEYDEQHRESGNGVGGESKDSTGGGGDDDDDYDLDSLVALASSYAEEPVGDDDDDDADDTNDGLTHHPLVNADDQSMHCAQCGNPNALFPCSMRCNQVTYCTRDCRTTHRKRHERFCDHKDDWSCFYCKQLNSGANYCEDRCLACGKAKVDSDILFDAVDSESDISVTDDEKDDDDDEGVDGGDWSCFQCTQENRGGHLACGFCGLKLDENEKLQKDGAQEMVQEVATTGETEGGADWDTRDSWACGVCTFRNAPGGSPCGVCGADKVETTRWTVISPDGSVSATWSPTAKSLQLIGINDSDPPMIGLLWSSDDGEYPLLLEAKVTSIEFATVDYQLWLNTEGGGRLILDLASKEIKRKD